MLGFCEDCIKELSDLSLGVRKLDDDFKVYSFYKYSEIKHLLYSKHKFYGYFVLNALAKLSFAKFVDLFSINFKVNAVALDDRVENFLYSHSAILTKHLKSKFVKPKFAVLQAQSNIKYSDETMSDERMVEAAEIAQATEFINEKEKKYQDPIAQGGGNVSGGQKQRLSIARAIAKDPEIFVFDDSFSALDFKTDSALREALATRTKNKTVIIVAQRISTILNADKIIVLEEGKMVGMGTHEELMKNNETYRQIALSQLSEEELGEKGGK